MSSQVSNTIRSVSEVHATPVASAFGTDLQMLDHFGRLYDVTHDLLCVVGFGGRSKFLNSSWESILGHSQEELMATHYIEFIHPDDRAATLADAEKVMAGIPTTSFENRLRCKDG
jgi:PAS domain S-box-containing protein